MRIWLGVDCGCNCEPGGGWGTGRPPGLALKNDQKIALYRVLVVDFVVVVVVAVVQ